MKLTDYWRRLQPRLLLGTPRRVWLCLFRPGYVRASLARRQGACRRCGACCRLAWRCRFFYHDKEIPACRLYQWFRTWNCSRFPIDRRDLADRDLIMPHQPCGYFWQDDA